VSLCVVFVWMVDYSETEVDVVLLRWYLTGTKFYKTESKSDGRQEEDKVEIVDAAGNMNTICLPRLYVVVAGLASEVSGLSRLLV